MSKFSAHWMALPTLSCISVFLLYLWLFCLTFLMHTPLPWNIPTCQGWTPTNGPQCGAGNMDSWIHTCVCPCRHIWRSDTDVFLLSLCYELWGRVSQWTWNFPIGWTGRPGILQTLLSAFLSLRNALPIPAHGAGELNLDPTLVQKTLSALSHPPAPHLTVEEIADAKPNVSQY